MSIHIDRDLAAELGKKGYMFGVKLTFNKNILGIIHSFDFFQSFHINKKGCLNTCGVWCPDSVFFRHSFSLGRIKLYFSGIIIDNAPLINQE
jgi:hypothetical protein